MISWRMAAAARDAGPFRFAVPGASAFALIPRTHSLMTTVPGQELLIRWDWKTGTQEACVTTEPYYDIRVSPDASLAAVRRDASALRIFRLASMSKSTGNNDRLAHAAGLPSSS